MFALRKIKNAINNMCNIDYLLQKYLRISYMENLSLTSKMCLINDSNKNARPKYIVSLTTYSKRIHDVHLTLESISLQSVKPDRVILWLDKDEFSIEELPLRVQNFQSRGLEIRFVKNTKSYKKYIPSSELYPDANIITIDDDIIYPADMIEILVNEHSKFPDHIIGHRAHYMKLDEKGIPCPYETWEFETNRDVTDKRIFITTGGGTLFPAGCFNDEVYSDDTLFMDICGTADDVWFYSMALLNDIKCKKVSDSRGFEPRFIITNLNDDIALENINVAERQNDDQLRRVMKYFNLQSRLVG